MVWTNKPLIPPLPPELLSIANTLSGVATTVGSVLDVLGQLLDIAKVFYQLAADPLKALVGAVIVEIEDFINSLFATGVYQLIVDPFAVVQAGQRKDRWGIPLLTPGDAINIAIKSFYDEGDLNRPMFPDTANVCALGFMVTTPSYGKILTLLESLWNVFKLDDMQFTLRKLQEAKDGPPPFSRPPDWDSIRLNQADDMAEIQKTCLDALSTVKGYIVTVDDIIIKLIDLIRKKVQDLEDAVDIFNLLISNIQAIADMNQALILDVPLGVGGIPRLEEELMHPALMANKTNQYTYMYLLVGGGPSADTVEILRGLMT